MQHHEAWQLSADGRRKKLLQTTPVVQQQVNDANQVVKQTVKSTDVWFSDTADYTNFGDRQTSIVDADNATGKIVTHQQYNALGQAVDSKIDANGDAEKTLQITKHYDVLGKQVISESRGYAGTTPASSYAYSYDGAGGY